MTCAAASAELGEAVAATAAVARTWLLVEQPGPWGAKALTSSRLDPVLGRALEDAAKGTGVRLGLIRRPGRHADTGQPAMRRVIVAHTAPDDPWVRTAEVEDPAGLAALDLAALGAGDHLGFGSAYEGPPIALVCTNGTRDRCCAVAGRPLAEALAASAGHEVWETTHLGGHRFAPTMLVLPHGYAYGRLDPALAEDVLDAAAAGLVEDGNCRGRSTWPRAGQAAELAVRNLIGERLAGALSVEPPEPAPAVDGNAAANGGPDPRTWSVRVVHADGRAWRALVAEVPCEPPRPESCGARLGTPTRMDVIALADAAPPGTSGRRDPTLAG
ncbi:sucrase ferredoxin [Actinacidiphila yeochonensis]|uniref:sucrase ferredoxin n=1 Tax=Actinacidiphila yeochonensis TaxID=89050 RepID=UPI0006923B6A|nr:sucrase ferredoxin [Actinacidiphila yeochonensis]